MIAYNHYIKFIPELENNKKVEDSFSDVITVEENSDLSLNNALSYKLTFFNNQGRDISIYTDREFACTQKEQNWAFEVKGVVIFFWRSNTLKLEYIKQEHFTEALLEYWCLHIVLPIFFTIEEKYDFLHAGAVEVEENPILFIAESFGGKSTMTDFFMKQGHTMISDDKVAIYEKNGNFFALPSHPHHRPYRKMEDLGFFVENFASKVKLIHGIYELKRFDPNAKIEIIELQGMEKFKSLRYASEMNIFFLKAKRFTFLSHLANVVPLYQVSVPWDMERLVEVHECIVKHSQMIKEENRL